jgi:hypothetical protein
MVRALIMVEAASFGSVFARRHQAVDHPGEASSHPREHEIVVWMAGDDHRRLAGGSQEEMREVLDVRGVDQSAGRRTGGACPARR